MDHEHNLPHQHEHLHCQGHMAQAISPFWKWAAVAKNGAFGALGLLAGNTSTLSLTADGLHNVGDAVAYYMQADNVLNHDLPMATRIRRRTVARWVMAASALAVSAKAGVELALDHDSASEASSTNMYIAGASLALDGLLLASLARGIRRRKRVSHQSTHTADERELLRHFLLFDLPSSALALSGTALQQYHVHLEHAIAVASGLFGACIVLFHNHDHDDIQRGQQKGWLERLRYQGRHRKLAR